jgi:MarR family transcriptional regulator, organic hydroperoxide resistance regulator
MASRGQAPRKAQPAKLASLIEEMMSHIHRRSADDTLAVMNEAGLTMAQMVALHLLTHLGPVSVSSIAACLKLSPPATSHLVDRMVVAGLVGRSEDPTDRRHKRIAITSTGRELIEGTNERRTREFTRVLASLSSDAQAQFGRALGRVVTELKGLPDREEVREIVGKELQKREAQAAQRGLEAQGGQGGQGGLDKRNKANRRP